MFRLLMLRRSRYPLIFPVCKSSRRSGIPFFAYLTCDGRHISSSSSNARLFCHVRFTSHCRYLGADKLYKHHHQRRRRRRLVQSYNPPFLLCRCHPCAILVPSFAVVCHRVPSFAIVRHRVPSSAIVCYRSPSCAHAFPFNPNNMYLIHRLRETHSVFPNKNYAASCIHSHGSVLRRAIASVEPPFPSLV